MAKLTDEMLKAIMPTAPKKARTAALPILNRVAYHYDIRNAERLRMWLSALAIESGELKYQEELASGAAYEGRDDLGNNERGDGRRFKGRGRIQLTGRDVYTKYSAYVRKSRHVPVVDFVSNPRRVAEEPYATDSAGWFVNGYKHLNPLADAHKLKEYHMKVNGRRKNRKTGEYEPNHWRERQNYYFRAKTAIPSNFELTLDEDEATIRPLHASEEVRNALEGTDGWPDFEPVPFETKDEDTEPNGLDSPVSSPDSEEVVGAGSTDKNGSTASETLVNGMPQTSSEPTKDETPQTLTKERPSIFARVMTGIFTFFATVIASITTTCGGSEVANIVATRGAERVVENTGSSELYTFGLVALYIALGLGAALLLFYIGAKIYEKAAERSNRLNQRKLEYAASKDHNTVEFVHNIVTKTEQT